MKPGEKEKRILAQIQIQADRPLSDIASATGYREHTIRNCLKQLREAGIIRKCFCINPYRLGYFFQIFYFSILPDSRKHRPALIDFLVGSPHTSYVVEVGGEYQFKVAICAKDLTDIAAFIQRLSEEFGNILHQKCFSTSLSVNDFPMKFLDPAAELSGSLAIGITEQKTECDDIDHRILQLLSRIGAMTFSELARKLEIPISTLEYRMRRLKQEQVIVGARYIIDLPALGMESFVHLVYVKGMSSEFRDQLFSYCREHRLVYYFMELIGSWEYEIGSAAANSQEVIAFGQELHDRFGPDLVKVLSLPLLRHHKVSNYPLKEFL